MNEDETKEYEYAVWRGTYFLRVAMVTSAMFIIALFLYLLK